MAKKSSSRTPAFRCSECGWATAKWVGRCGECQAWGTVSETGTDTAGPRTRASSIGEQQRAQSIVDVDASFSAHHPTGVPELDRVLGGGIIPGAVILMAGEPGVGKSTLVLDVAARVARQHRAAGGTKRCLYLTGEESAAQVRMRADRIGALADTLYLTAVNDLATALGHIEDQLPELLIVDSVQTLQSLDVEGGAGGVTQIREVAGAIINAAKTRNITTILVGHVTKDGSIAGPRTLEHLVDVVCQFEGDRHSRLRMVRAVKNRYGSTDEVGCFDLQESGIVSVEDPSGLFISPATHSMPGTALTVTLEGRRPLLAEVQALVSTAQGGPPQKSVSGFDRSRMNMILAVMQARCDFTFQNNDVFVSTVGGMKLSEPAADLAVAAALSSAQNRSPIPPGIVVFGEVGLSGELRPVPGMMQRLYEASRLGFDRAIVPGNDDSIDPQAIPGFQIREETQLDIALRRLYDPPTRRGQLKDTRPFPSPAALEGSR